MARGQHRRGTALLLAIFFLTVLFFLAMALLELMPVEMNATLRQRRNQEAYYAADAGITEAIAWIEHELTLELEPSHDFTTNTGPNARHVMLGALGTDWKWEAEIRPDPETSPLGSSSVRMYTIKSTARLFDVAYRRITAVVGQESFAKYAMFFDKGGVDLSFDVANNQIDGPMHLNDVLRLVIPDGFFGSSGAPAFTGQVTSSVFYGPKAGDGAEYKGLFGQEAALPYNSDGSPIPERYNRLFAGGRESLRTGAQAKPMPLNSKSLADAAWGNANSAPPAAPGVYVNAPVTTTDFGEAAGGVFIQGDVEKMVLGVSSDGNSTVKVTQGGQDTLVTVLSANGLTLDTGTKVNGQPLTQPLILTTDHTVIKKPDGSYDVVQGKTNGVVYASGSILSLSGTNKGRRTVAVDTQQNKEIVLTGDLTRSDTAVGSRPSNETPGDALGLVAYNVRVSRDVPRSQENPLYLYCSIFAGRKDGSGGFAVDGFNERPGEMGKFIIYGGLIEGQDKPWGHIAAQCGFKYDIHYDGGLGKAPPPFFPNLPKIHVLSWTEEMPQAAQATAP